MTKLCKTNPNSKMPKLTHTLFYKGLMKIFAPFGHQKTNPKRTQTKPNSERAKMTINSVKTKDYENKLVFRHKKNEPKTNPISIMGKNEHNLSLHKGLWKWTPLESPKKQSQFKPNFSKPKIVTKNGHFFELLSPVFAMGGKYHNHVLGNRIVDILAAKQ